MKHVRVMTLGVVALLAGAVLVSCRPQGPKGPQGKVPVIFVPGYGEDGTMWDTAVAYFTAHGYKSSDITRFEYVSKGEGAIDATQAAAKLAETVETVRKGSRHSRVDIVAHSLGNLVTKACIVEGGCKNKVAHWANIAGAQNGTALAAPEYCPDPACVDMRPGSELITRLQAADDTQIARQRVKVQVHWTVNDGIIVPPEGSKEVYADNVQVADTLDHFTIFIDEGVLRDTVAFLGGATPPRPPVTTPTTGPRTTGVPPTTRATTIRPTTASTARPTTTTTVDHGHGDHGH